MKNLISLSFITDFPTGHRLFATSSRKTRFRVGDFRLVKLDGKSMTISFVLDSGIYATVLIRELAYAIGDNVGMG